MRQKYRSSCFLSGESRRFRAAAMSRTIRHKAEVLVFLRPLRKILQGRAEVMAEVAAVVFDNAKQGGLGGVTAVGLHGHIPRFDVAVAHLKGVAKSDAVKEEVFFHGPVVVLASGKLQGDLRALGGGNLGERLVEGAVGLFALPPCLIHAPDPDNDRNDARDDESAEASFKASPIPTHPAPIPNKHHPLIIAPLSLESVGKCRSGVEPPTGTIHPRKNPATDSRPQCRSGVAPPNLVPVGGCTPDRNDPPTRKQRNNRRKTGIN